MIARSPGTVPVVPVISLLITRKEVLTLENYYIGSEGPITVEAAAEAPVRVFGAFPFHNAVATFQDHDSFVKWAGTLPQKDRVAEALRRVDVARAYSEKDIEELKAEQAATAAVVAAGIDKLAQRLGLDPNAEEVFLKATSVDADPITGPVLHSAQLFEHHNCTGRRFDMNSWTFYQDFSTVGFNNIVSSVRVGPLNLVALFRDAWFQGPVTYFWGGLWWSNSYNLDAQVNDTASSGWCIGLT